MAARHLRSVHGITSINANNLEKALSLLKLRPRRLVRQGLAPRPLLRAVNQAKKQEAQDGAMAVTSTPPIATEAPKNDNLDAAAVEWEVLNADGDAAGTQDKHGEAVTKDVAGVEDAQKEVSAEGNEKKPTMSGEPELITSAQQHQADSTTENGGASPGGGKPVVIGGARMVKPNHATRMPIYAALVAGGVKIRPRETRPLLYALGVRPMRLVRLGLVDRAALAAVQTLRHGRGAMYKLHGPGGAGIPGKLGGGRGLRGRMHYAGQPPVHGPSFRAPPGRMHGGRIPGGRARVGAAAGAGAFPPPPPQQRPRIVLCHRLVDGHAGRGMMRRPGHPRRVLHAPHHGMRKGGERPGPASGGGFARGGGGRRGGVRGNGGRGGRGAQASSGGDKPSA